ncbi:MAG: phosphatidate cytidylyltransferase, partial [Allorhizobium sp.]
GVRRVLRGCSRCTARARAGQLTWTILILLMVVFQTRAITHNIFEGLFWFLLPTSLVVCNDSFAYFTGQAFGKRFIKAPFLSLSPRKTWEGFIGAFIITCVFGFFFSRLLAQVGRHRHRRHRHRRRRRHRRRALR